MTESLEQSKVDTSVSDNFGSPDAEIVFQSSNGVLFRIHRMNLVACAPEISPPENSTFSEIVYLTEPSQTLELLFQFIYPRPLPDLSEIDFEVLAQLAEAAEKYRIFSAMNLCTIYLMEHIQNHPEEILLHAVRHRIHKLATRAAPLLLDRPLEDFLSKLPDSYVIAWVRYRAYWTRTLMSAISRGTDISDAPTPTSQKACTTCKRLPHQYMMEAIGKLSTKLSVLQDMDAQFPSHDPQCCPARTSYKAWKDALCAEVLSLPTFAEVAFLQIASKSPTKEENTISGNDVSGSTSHNKGSSGLSESQEITFKSSDGVIFRLKEETVQSMAMHLLPPQHDHEQSVLLPESSTTLELLFQFFVADQHPDLEGADYGILGPLSLAADLYGVPSALSVCNIRMAQAQPYDLINRTSDVMRYALKSQSLELMNKCAPLMIKESLVKMADVFKDSDKMISWFKYLEQWSKVAHDALSFSEHRCVSSVIFYTDDYGRISARRCKGCKSINADLTTIAIMRKLGQGVTALADLNDTFETTDACCSTSRENIEVWREGVEIAIQEIPHFTNFTSTD